MARPSTVRVSTGTITLPTRLPAAPDKNPMFLEKRVYQGSSGKIYPLPFTDRISETETDRRWKAVWLENQFLRVLILPEIGGRIHRLVDKTNGYDLIYYQPTIKPALVGLAGPWISGGIEFNWPQHHRPATFLPVDFTIEKHEDGSKTVWCSDHDPICRMKGMHGVCLHPGKSYVELKVRTYNRTPLTQTFLWWANVATRVHEGYQSFFPPDVYYVADHARRSMSEYPLAKSFYYGVNYGERGRKGIPLHEIPTQFIPPHCSNSKLKSKNLKLPPYPPNDLSFYANIPTPCSYMCMGSKEDFFGGYDFFNEAGIIHVADHRIAPGKKQWTWGNHPFGYAWDRNLTDPDGRGEYGPYIELMAGVYTDNQPDFSFLQPGETKTWSQFWYPIQKIGPAQHANLAAALSLKLQKRKARLGLAVTAEQHKAKITLSVAGRPVARFTRDLVPGAPWVKEVALRKSIHPTDLLVRVTDAADGEIISYQARPRAKGKVPPPADEPPAPADVASADELFLIGLHLEQYRHATRCPTLYWHEALRRDPLDSRCNNAIGRWHLRRGEFEIAETHFRRAIKRLTRRNANPYDGEAFYNLGLCLRYQSDSNHKSKIIDHKLDEAYDAFYKSVWNEAWMAAGYHALAEIDCARKDWSVALDHLNRSLRFNADNLRARNLKVIMLRKLAGGQASRLSQIERKKLETAATAVLRETLALDPLDWWARYLAGKRLECDAQTALDLAHDFARAGLFEDAIVILASSALRQARLISKHWKHRENPLPDRSLGAAPLVQYTLAWIKERSGYFRSAKVNQAMARFLTADYCFPSRLEEIPIFESAMRANPKDPRAPYYLGNLFYDRRRHEEAIRLWEKSARLDPDFSIVWRNLGIGYFNIRRAPAKARAAYDKAFQAAPGDARLLYERDQLWKRLGDSPSKRLRELEKHSALVAQRDDLSVELCALYNQTGQSERALDILSARKFQPWEGGEGQALGQHVRARLALGRMALARRDYSAARRQFENALTSPENLGEARHLLANQSDVHYWLGVALDRLGDRRSAREHWRVATTFRGDFQEMSARAFSEMTYYSALSRERLGQKAQANTLFRQLLAHAQQLQKAPAKIDYFATSLPTMLLFDDDLHFRQETTAFFFQAQAQLGLGHKNKAQSLLAAVLKRDPSHALAADLAAEIAQSKRT